MLAYAAYQGGELFFSGRFESRELATSECRHYMRRHGYTGTFHIVRVDTLPPPNRFEQTHGAPAIFEFLDPQPDNRPKWMRK